MRVQNIKAPIAARISKTIQPLERAGGAGDFDRVEGGGGEYDEAEGAAGEADGEYEETGEEEERAAARARSKEARASNPSAGKLYFCLI